MLWKNTLTPDVPSKVSPQIKTLTWWVWCSKTTHYLSCQHLIQKDSIRPPVHWLSVRLVRDDLLDREKEKILQTPTFPQVGLINWWKINEYMLLILIPKLVSPPSTAGIKTNTALKRWQYTQKNTSSCQGSISEPQMNKPLLNRLHYFELP